MYAAAYAPPVLLLWALGVVCRLLFLSLPEALQADAGLLCEVIAVLGTLVQKDKDRDVEAPAEDAKEASKESPDAALVQAQAAAAAAAARRLNTSAAAAEHVCIAAMKRAAEFVKVRRILCRTVGIPCAKPGLRGSGRPPMHDQPLLPSQSHVTQMMQSRQIFCGRMPLA